MKKVFKKTVSMYDEEKLRKLYEFLGREIKLSSVSAFSYRDFEDSTKINFMISLDGEETQIDQFVKLLNE